MVITVIFKTDKVTKSKIKKELDANGIWILEDKVFDFGPFKGCIDIEHRFLVRVLELLKDIGVDVLEHRISSFKRNGSSRKIGYPRALEEQKRAQDKAVRKERRKRNRKKK